MQQEMRVRVRSVPARQGLSTVRGHITTQLGDTDEETIISTRMNQSVLKRSRLSYGKLAFHNVRYKAARVGWSRNIINSSGEPFAMEMELGQWSGLDIFCCMCRFIAKSNFLTPHAKSFSLHLGT